MNTQKANPILVVGIPRSGTTWTGEVLGHALRSQPLHEPDNEKEYLHAMAAKRSLGRFPALQPGDLAAGYYRFWREQIDRAGAPDAPWPRAQLWWSRRSPGFREHVLTRIPGAVGLLTSRVAAPPVSGSESVAIIKSVHAVLALEWFAGCFPEVRIVVVLRHPAAVLNSWLQLRLPDMDRGLYRRQDVQRIYMTPWGLSPPPELRLHRAAWQVSLLTAAVADAVSRHPEWHVAVHEDLCGAPEREFAGLVEGLGTTWTSQAAQFLRASDQEGSGFETHRRTAEQPTRWRRELSTEARAVLTEVSDGFPHLERWRQDW